LYVESYKKRKRGIGPNTELHWNADVLFVL
jgi:hypothetical protein